MVKQAAAERRRAIRAKRILSIQYRLVNCQRRGVDKAWHLSTTHDISFSGLSFFSAVPCQVGDILELRVVMAGVLDIFKGRGQVVRIERKKTGVFYFIALKYVEAKVIKRKVKKTTAKRRITSLKKSPRRK